MHFWGICTKSSSHNQFVNGENYGHQKGNVPSLPSTIEMSVILLVPGVLSRNKKERARSLTHSALLLQKCPSLYYVGGLPCLACAQTHTHALTAYLPCARAHAHQGISQLSACMRVRVCVCVCVYIQAAAGLIKTGLLLVDR